MHGLIICNKGLLEECNKNKLWLTGAAAASCSKRRL